MSSRATVLLPAPTGPESRMIDFMVLPLKMIPPIAKTIIRVYNVGLCVSQSEAGPG
jgi:hypothetical protein